MAAPLVFLTGGTGFVGRHVRAALLARGARVRCLVRPGSRRRTALEPSIQIALGDISDTHSLSNGLAGADAVIHLVGIIRETSRASFRAVHTEGTRNVVAAMRERGVQRIVHMSALGARSGVPAEYFRTKCDAEEIVMRNGLAWTVFRPAIIHGPDGEFTRLLAGMVRRPLPVPVIGDGQYRLQPIYVDDVARVLAEAALDGRGAGAAFEVGGPRVYTYDELVDAFARTLTGRTHPKVHVPVPLVRTAARVFETLTPAPPVTREQITMLLASAGCDNGPVLAEFGGSFAPLEETLAKYAGTLGK